MLNLRSPAIVIGIALAVIAPSSADPVPALHSIKLLVQSTTMPHTPVVISVQAIQKLYPDFDPASFVVMTGDARTVADDARASHLRTLPSQADDPAGAGKASELAFETAWPVGQQRVVTIQYGSQEALAPLRSGLPPAAHVLFSPHYEGLGWESDRVAWRLYFDKRNAVDLYGKRQPGLSLDYFARPDVNYENDSPFGRDIFWNGPVATGIGSLCACVNGHVVRVSDVTLRKWKIVADGPVRAIAEVDYTGWNVGGRSVDMTNRFTIWAGQHWFKNDISATNAAGLTFVTGLPGKPGVTLSNSAAAGRQHRFLTTWGAQVQRPGDESVRVNGDNLGLAVIMSHGPVPPSDTGPLLDSSENLMAISTRTNANVTTGRYAVLAGWDQETQDGQLPDAARSAETWRKYIEAINPDLFTTAPVTILSPAESAETTAHPSADMLTAPRIIATMRRACDYQLAQPSASRSNGWVNSLLYAGVMALYGATQDAKYLDKTRKWADDFQWSPKPTGSLNADNQCCLQTYAELAMLLKDNSRLDAAIAAYDHQIASPKPGRDQWYWCDALFMAPPGMVRVSAAIGDPKYTTLMNRLWWDTADFLYDPDEHLFYRDKRFFKARTANGKKVFWSRGNGWVMGGTVRVLDYLPGDDPNRGRFVALHQAMAAKVATLQGSDGMWRSSLLDAAQYPMPETSGTALITYALAWGINHGTLDRATYLPVVRKAWLGLVSELEPSGRLGYVQSVDDAPRPAAPEHTEHYAAGAFLLAGCEMAKLASR
ncbi:MAG: glycoside hydrolase family 88 protein [Capsulimonadaceae bacterium]|nr:glycoside hydrolase family 88 protein [Capsulimonadaceae bacterium]